MGGCCCSQVSVHEVECEHGGERIMLRGSSEFISMYSKKGSKGVNQDALTVWKVRFLMYMCLQFWLHFQISLQ